MVDLFMTIRSRHCQYIHQYHSCQLSRDKSTAASKKSFDIIFIIINIIYYQ